MESLLKGLEAIEEKLQAKKIKARKELRKRGTEIGRCVICGTFTDDPNNFTCGHPHCNKELREVLKDHMESEILLNALMATSVDDALAKIEQMKEMEKNLRTDIQKLLSLLSAISTAGGVEKLEAMKNSIDNISRLV